MTPGRTSHPEEGIKDFCEVIQEDGGRRTPHFQTAAFTAFSDRRAQRSNRSGISAGTRTVSETLLDVAAGSGSTSRVGLGFAARGPVASEPRMGRSSTAE